MNEIGQIVVAVGLAFLAQAVAIVKWLTGNMNTGFAKRDVDIEKLKQDHNDERVHVAENYVKKEELKTLEKKIEALEVRLYEKMDQIQLLLSSFSS